MNQRLVNHFLKLVKINTQSVSTSETIPSTQSQKEFAKMLQLELEELGLTEISLDEFGYLTATLDKNCDKNIPVIGFIAHMDTAPDYCGENVKPQIIKNYNGRDIVLKGTGEHLSPKSFPEIKRYIGETLITTDGTTLLGADDKAGIAEIFEMVRQLKETPSIEHGVIKIAFTPDEEIGRGADHFNVKKFGADFAYTVDGEQAGEFGFETFNAAEVKIDIKGINIHPGFAKNKLLSSISVAEELNAMLPFSERPEYTENYEGFFFLMKFDGTIENTHLEYIVRDHGMKKFEARKQKLKTIVAYLNEKYGEGTVSLAMKDQYYNMAKKVEERPYINELAISAMKKAGLKIRVKPVRGGTDGSKLSFMGLPTPNLFAGYHNEHGKFEFISVGSMEKAVEVMINIVSLAAEAE